MKRFIAWIKRSRSKKAATRPQETQDPVSTRSRDPDGRRSAPAPASLAVAHTAPKTVATAAAATAANADRMSRDTTAVEMRAPAAQPSFVKSFSAPSGGDAVASFRESLSATRRRAAPPPPPPPSLLYIRSDPSDSRPATAPTDADRAGPGLDGGSGGGGGGSDEVVRVSYSRPSSLDPRRAAAATAQCVSTFESLASPSRPRDIPERAAAARHSRTGDSYRSAAPTAQDDDADAGVAVGSPAYASLPTPESLMPPEMPRSLAVHLSAYSAERSAYAHSPARASAGHRSRTDDSGRDEAIAHSIESEEDEGDESDDAESGGVESDEDARDIRPVEKARYSNASERDDGRGGGGGGGVAENLRHPSESTAPASRSIQRRSREWHAEFRRRHATPPTVRPETHRSVSTVPSTTATIRTTSAAPPAPTGVRRPTDSADDPLVRRAVAKALAHDRVWAVERHSWKPREAVWVDLCVLHRRCARRLTGTVCEYACSIQECGTHYYTFDYHSRRSAHLTWEMAARLRREELAELANAKPQGLSLLRSWRSTPEGLCR